MSKFKIIRENPDQFRKDIVKFWEEYLPGTSAGRFDWMKNNPAGPAIWLFAIEENTGKVAGTISLFPKDLFLDGKKIKAAILGDFMIHERFRVYGPALSLLRAAIEINGRGEFDFLYTIPNLKSRKIVEKSGFRPAGNLYSLMLPQQCNFVTQKYVGSLGAKIVDKPLLLMLKILSRATYSRCPSVFEDIDWHDESFNELCQNVHQSRVGLMISDCSLKYLEWRYRHNPQSHFRVVTFRRQAGSDIEGYFVISSNDERVELYECVALEDRVFLAMISKIGEICKHQNCRGVYSYIYEKNPLLSAVRRCGFFNTRDQVEMYTYPETVEECAHWCCTAADRNM